MRASALRLQGRFVPGVSYSPSTQFKAGEHRAPATEFRKGQAAHNKLPVGSVTIRTRNGAQRAFVKIAEPNVWRERAKVVWEAANGKRLPRGHVIHHDDRRPLNDDIGNLVLLTRAAHIAEHRNDLHAARGIA